MAGIFCNRKWSVPCSTDFLENVPPKIKANSYCILCVYQKRTILQFQFSVGLFVSLLLVFWCFLPRSFLILLYLSSFPFLDLAANFFMKDRLGQFHTRCRHRNPKIIKGQQIQCKICLNFRHRYTQQKNIIVLYLY